MARSDPAAAVSAGPPGPPQWRRIAAGRILLWIACVPLLLYLMLPALIVVPMALTKGQFLQFPPIWVSLHSFRDFFDDHSWVDSALISAKVAVLAVVIALAAGVSAGLALHGSSFVGKRAVTAIILTPIVVPLVVLALADYLLFDALRLGGSWVAIGLAHALLGTPYVFIAIQTSLVGLRPALVRSAQSLGAGPLAVLRHVYWPALRPGVLSGMIFAFAASFDEVVIALFLQSPSATTLPIRMFNSIQYDLTPKLAAASSLLLCFAVVVLTAQAVLMSRRSAEG
jgi:ABC-type spermidine/putrescine transport system permease subunit II